MPARRIPRFLRARDATFDVVARPQGARSICCSLPVLRGCRIRACRDQLTPEQVRIYDAYAGAFGIIHNNLEAAMRAANITGETGTLNGQATSAARSAFESAKQRFFGHLLTSMKTPSLIRSIERDLDAGHAAVIQLDRGEERRGMVAIFGVSDEKRD